MDAIRQRYLYIHTQVIFKKFKDIWICPITHTIHPSSKTTFAQIRFHPYVVLTECMIWICTIQYIQPTIMQLTGKIINTN